jgi:hypothetical protein
LNSSATRNRQPCVLVVLTKPVACESGEDLEPVSLEALPSCRVVYTRYRSPGHSVRPFGREMGGRSRGPRIDGPTSSNRLMYLGSFLRNRGITGFDGWILLECTAMSADATTIVGSGYDPRGTQRAFIVQLTEPPTRSLGVAIPEADSLLRQRPNRSEK